MKKSTILLTIFLIILFLVIILGIKSNNKTVPTNASLVSSALSNKKIGWGIKRVKNHKQPDLGKTNIDLLNEVQAIAMGRADKNYVYLTFDEGYEAGYTESILKTLKENNVKATFFITAHYLNSKTDLVKKMVEDGHIIGNHRVSTIMSIN